MGRFIIGYTISRSMTCFEVTRAVWWRVYSDERHASAYSDFAGTGKESDDWFYFRPVAQVGEYESLDYFPES